jgi:hypothetical protein
MYGGACLPALSIGDGGRELVRCGKDCRRNRGAKRENTIASSCIAMGTIVKALLRVRTAD